MTRKATKPTLIQALCNAASGHKYTSQALLDTAEAWSEMGIESRLRTLEQAVKNIQSGVVTVDYAPSRAKKGKR